MLVSRKDIESREIGSEIQEPIPWLISQVDVSAELGTVMRSKIFGAD